MRADRTRRDAAAAELIRDIHASDRIERLTGNPMLLTTMALIKRKIGRLPQRRVDLYEKAVEVLLNWRSQVDGPLDPREALPQLEYLAHAMCADGVQQVREDQALDLLRRVRAKDMAEALAPLAGQVGERYSPDDPFQREFAVVENWREALRLCIAACDDDAVDAALLAILSPLPGETFTARPRAIMAALCLADEPDVSHGMAEETCRVFVAAIEKSDGWRSPPFSLAGVALRLPHLVLKRRDRRLHDLASGLTRRLLASSPMRYAAVRALAWLSLIPDEDSGWRPDCEQLARLVAAVMRPDCESETLYWLAHIFGYAKTGHAVIHLLARLPESPPRTQAAILNALGAIGDRRGLNALQDYLESDDKFLRIAALDGLAKTCEDEFDRQLLSQGRDGVNPLLDPRSPISVREIAIAAERLERPPQEIRERYERLAKQFGLRLE